MKRIICVASMLLAMACAFTLDRLTAQGFNDYESYGYAVDEYLVIAMTKYTLAGGWSGYWDGDPMTDTIRKIYRDVGSVRPNTAYSIMTYYTEKYYWIVTYIEWKEGGVYIFRLK